MTLSAWRRGERAAWAFAAVASIFASTTVVNVVERPDGVKIASLFIAAIVAVSPVSRPWRPLELRAERFEPDGAACRFVEEAGRGEVHVSANRPDDRGAAGYGQKGREARADFLVPPGRPMPVLEVYVRDPSDFTDVSRTRGVDVGGHRVPRADAKAVPNAIAAFLLHVRDTTGRRPRVYFHRGESHPLRFIIRYLPSGQGDNAPVTHEVLWQAKPDPTRRPSVRVGG